MLLYTMLAYLMLLTALFIATYLHNACLAMVVYFAFDYCIVIIYTNALCFHALSLSY